MKTECRAMAGSLFGAALCYSIIVIAAHADGIPQPDADGLSKLNAMQCVTWLGGGCLMLAAYMGYLMQQSTKSVDKLSAIVKEMSGRLRDRKCLLDDKEFMQNYLHPKD